MKILIVEDEQHLADGLKFNIEAEGYVAEIAADGEIALGRLGQDAFDAVVLDVMLPKVDGFEVAKTMRERGDYTPILMLTARGRPEDVLQGFEAGTDDYLAKPFDLEIFLARLNGLLRRRRWLEKESKSKDIVSLVTVNGRTIEAVFKMVNDAGGVNGRKITLLSYDDGYAPPKTVELTRKLVEEDKVLFIFNPLGTAPNTAIYK